MGLSPSNVHLPKEALGRVSQNPRDPQNRLFIPVNVLNKSQFIYLLILVSGF